VQFRDVYYVKYINNGSRNVDSIFAFSQGGLSAIRDRLQAKKHKNCIKAAYSNIKLNSQTGGGGLIWWPQRTYSHTTSAQVIAQLNHYV
jgi:hypothetical protein